MELLLLDGEVLSHDPLEDLHFLLARDLDLLEIECGLAFDGEDFGEGRVLDEVVLGSSAHEALAALILLELDGERLSLERRLKVVLQVDGVDRLEVFFVGEEGNMDVGLV